MQAKHYFQKLLPEKNGKQTQSFPLMYAAESNEGDEGGLDLGQLLASMRRRAFVIAGVTVTVAVAAVAQALISTPTYKGKFELLIQPVTIESKLTTSPTTVEREPRDVGETELKILQSPKLISPILKQLEARYPGSLKTQSSGKSLPELTFNLIPKTNIVEVSYEDPNREKAAFVLDLLSKAYLVYSLEERRTDVRQGIQFVEEQLPKLHKQVETLQIQLQRFRQQYDLIDPESQGKQLSDQLNATVQQRLDIQTQLAKTRALYHALQKQLQMQSNEATVSSALSENPRYQSLLNQLQEIRTKIAVESARYQEDSPTIQTLRAQEQNLLPLVQTERRGILGNNQPSLIKKSQALASPNSVRLQQTQQFVEAANQIQALEAQYKALTQAESLLRQQFKQFPILVRQNDDLERQLKIAVENLNQFLTKREALRIELAQKQVPWQLLTPPTKPQPALISAKQNLVLGTALGLLLGIGAALLVDKFKNLIYTSEEVKDTTGLPLLGELPFKQEHKQLQNFRLGKSGKQSQQQYVSQFWESLRSLCTNIRFLSFDSPVRSLAIISASSEDGRSTVAMHLAQTAAVMGQRVLLVDADLRNPKIHTMLGLPNTRGLSNVIAADLDFQEALHRVNCISMEAQDDGIWEAAKDSLFVLTAGQVPPNPTNLLSSQKMQNIARQLEAAFDLIIYDTPPISGLADSSLLAAHADASILVVRLGNTQRSTLEKVLDGLKISSTPILGVVANGVKE